MKPGDRRWVATRGASLASVLDSMGAHSALSDGRVFVNGKRFRCDVELDQGDVVDVFDAWSSGARARVLDQRADIVIAYKPAGLPTIAGHRGDDCLLTHVAESLGVGVAELHAWSRLDVGVSGAVVLARSRAARGDLAKMGLQREIERTYVGVSSTSPSPAAGHWTGAVRGKPARTAYRTIAVAKSSVLAAPRATSGSLRSELVAPTLLSMTPETGRTHQLRIHCAGAGAPLFGDALHGGVKRLTRSDGSVVGLGRIALHAKSIALHALGWRVDAPVPDELRSLWRDLFGSDDDW